MNVVYQFVAKNAIISCREYHEGMKNHSFEIRVYGDYV
jgi:hypothetical protein